MKIPQKSPLTLFHYQLPKFSDLAVNVISQWVEKRFEEILENTERVFNEKY